jgi:hypothetical protein
VTGLVGARVQRARSGQGVQSMVRKVACTIGSAWRLVPGRQLWAVLPFGAGDLLAVPVDVAPAEVQAILVAGLPARVRW